jgi:hypothetical protein
VASPSIKAWIKRSRIGSLKSLNRSATNWRNASGGIGAGQPAVWGEKGLDGSLLDDCLLIY